MTTRFFVPILAVGAVASAATHPDMLVTSDWLAKHRTDSKIAILHVSGSRTAYDAGHIPGARFVLRPTWW